MGSSSPIPPGVREQAVAWLVELQAETASDDTRQRWRQWRDAHRDHARAWARIEAFGDKLQGLPPPLAHATLDGVHPNGRRRALKTLSGLLAVGAAAWLAHEQAPWREWRADRRTAVGERARLVLADGTEVRMNADSALDIVYSATERRLTLLRGEILVTTARDRAARPFSVDTAQGNARALGTRFVVRQLAQRSVVAVLDGAVELRPALAGAPLLLHPGQQASFSGAAAGAPETVDEAVTAWIDGMIVAHDMPLADFLAALRPYRKGHLRCDEAAARLTVSGTYPLADSDKVLDILQTTLPIEIRQYTRYWIAVRAKKIQIR